MAFTNQDLTFDCIPNILPEDETTECPSVLAEIERCRILYNQRQSLKKKKAIDIKPLYYEHMKKRDFVAKYPVYKWRCTFPKTTKKYDPCQHIGQIIIDRDILTKDEYLSYLAQPKQNYGRYVRPPRCVYQKRFLPNCTTRIDSLANPKPIRVQHNWKDYSHLLTVRQATNLRKTLQRPPIEYTTIENAITYIHEENRLQNEMKNEELKRCKRMKRKLEKKEQRNMTKILLSLYEIMKEFLMDDKFVIDSSETGSLCRVLETKIIEFCGFENASTSHVQQLIKTLAQNLAIWIEKFTSNCGFKNEHSKKEVQRLDEVCRPPIEEELLLPVEDFIPYRSPSVSDLGEGYRDELGYEEVDEYEINK